jgi:hypothetical protein
MHIVLTERNTAMGDNQALIRQVRHNCTVSDARFAGIYSVCGLAMRLRDLYKWENGLPPHEEHEAQRVLDWIGRKEERWEALQDSEYQDIAINGKRRDPFDTRGINRAIAPLNLFYGAGYAQSLKPSFLLAEIEETTTAAGHPVLILGAEQARDLLSLPALTQDHAIIVRKSALEFYVWDQILYLSRSGRPFFHFALSQCGVPEKDAGSLRRCLPVVAAAQMDTFLYHEVGELEDTAFDATIWREILAALPHTTTEFLSRSVKDILADTASRGTLPQIVRSRNTAALGFYAAFLDGLRKSLFPEIRTAVEGFLQDGSWQEVEAMIAAVQQKAETMADTITAVFNEGRRHHNWDRVTAELDRRYIRPLAKGSATP